jgi:hypothetical protein
LRLFALVGIPANNCFLFSCFGIIIVAKY